MLMAVTTKTWNHAHLILLHTYRRGVTLVCCTVVTVHTRLTIVVRFAKHLNIQSFFYLLNADGQGQCQRAKCY